MKLFDLDSWQETAAVLLKHPLRTALTALGVVLGIFILIAMVGFGRAFDSGVKKTMAGFANNAVFTWGQSTTLPYSGLPPDRPIRFNNGDIAALAGLDGVEYVAPRNQRGGFMGGSNVRYGTKTGGFQVAGDYPAIQYVQTPLMRAGRFLNDADIAERRKICVVGESVVEQLMSAGDNPIGKHIDVSGVYFEIVGVFGTRSTGNQADRLLNTIHIPFTTFQQAFNVGDEVGWFAITGRRSVSADDLESQIRNELAKRHRFDPDDERDHDARRRGGRRQQHHADQRSRANQGAGGPQGAGGKPARDRAHGRGRVPHLDLDIRVHRSGTRDWAARACRLVDHS
jgi:putative ABC transport system permease protein